MTYGKTESDNRARAGKLGGNRQSAADIRECRHTLAELAVERDRKIDAAKDTYTTTALPVQNRVKELEGQVKAFVDGHRAELVGKSRALNFGVVGYRLSSKLVLPKGRVEDVIAQLKALGRDNLIKRTETLDREALRRNPRSCCASWARTSTRPMSSIMM